MSLGPSPSPRRSLLMATLATLVVAGVSWWAYRQLSDPGPSHSLIDLLQEMEPAPLAPGAAGRQAPKPPPQAPWSSPLARQCAGDRALAKRLRQNLASYRRNAITLNIHPSNYGERFQRDAYGNRLDPTPRLVVLHETVYGIGSAINTFLTRHDADEQQVSYHTLIGLDGTIVPVLDPKKRAFGAGYSGFNGAWAVTKASIGGSVNNFALHLSLETPLDGENDAAGHSGYSQAQYDSLAVVLADWMERFPIPAEHITTHRHVDLGSERADPRSFAWAELGKRMAALGLLCR